MRCRSYRDRGIALARALPSLAFGDNYSPSMHGPGLGRITVTESKALCQEKPIRPKRPHRRRRVQKKWIKRHGWVMGGCVGHGYQMAGVGIVGCSHWIAKLHKGLAT